MRSVQSPFALIFILFPKAQREKGLCGEVEAPSEIEAGMDHFIDKRIGGYGHISVKKIKPDDRVAEGKQQKTDGKDGGLFKVCEGKYHVYNEIRIVEH